MYSQINFPSTHRENSVTFSIPKKPIPNQILDSHFEYENYEVTKKLSYLTARPSLYAIYFQRA